ncbi:MAG: hypothetical protein EBZ91_03770 [Gammaproteobacteria bacterium]|nr:hypothetical protein [Gammaproteobacteria bacterium]
MAGVPLSVRKALTIAFFALALSGAAAQSTAPAAQADARLADQAALKQALERNDLSAAATLATQIVAKSEERFGKESAELVNPLTNLGTVAYRSGDFVAAEAAYQRAVRLIDGQLSGADRRLVRPLQGLGETWLAAGKPNEAAAALKRAVDLSRNLDGLYNLEQLDLVDALIEALEGADRLTEAEREHQNAFRVVETAYGKKDLRLVEPLDRYARWYETVGRYATARGLHARALQLAEELSPTKPVVGVPALRGLARTWLLEALYGPEVEPTTAGPEMSDGTELFAPNAGAGRLNNDGERALRFALAILDAQKPIDTALRSDLSRANGLYADAWKALDATPEQRKWLESPRLLFYRAPATAASRLRPADPSEYVAREVRFRIRVGRDGKVIESTVESSDAPEATQKSAAFALRRARYAPRLENGEPAESEGVPFRETLLVKIPKEQPATPAPEAPHPAR